MTEIERLQQIGLNKYEAEAYYTLLAQGPLTGYELGKRSPVPLSRSYEILERLTQKGLALIQPGDPPRYAASDPALFLGRVRADMTETLDALARALSSLPQADTGSEFWIVRGRQHILDRARSMIASAQGTLHLHLPIRPGESMTGLQVFAQAQSSRLTNSHISNGNIQDASILLLIDGREALIGSLALTEQSQALVSSSPALILLLNRYFNNVPTSEKSAQAAIVKIAQPGEQLAWIAWEERKQRRLWSIPSENHVA